VTAASRICAAIVIGLALLLSSPISSLASERAKGGTVIACFHPQISRYTARSHPRRCDIRAEKRGEFIGIPIKDMRWGLWGNNPTRAAYGVDVLDGARVRVIAYRPVPCDDGRNWYSRVVILFLGDGHASGFHLLTCPRPSVVG
jgi:hypothetical protein